MTGNTLARKGWVILLALFLTMFGDERIASAETGNSKSPSPIVVGLMTPDIPATLCAGEKISLEYYFAYVYAGKAAPLIPQPLRGNVLINATNGKVTPEKFVYPRVMLNKTYTGNFTYTADKKAGTGTIAINVSAGYTAPPFTVTFKIVECEASILFGKQSTFSYDVTTMITTYTGSGLVTVTENGEITGTGSQTIWGTILPYSSEEGSCTQNSPWEGSAGISFSGQMGEDGNAQVTMTLETLNVNAATLTCTSEDYSGSMTFPEYTFGQCEVQIDNFSFKGGTQNVTFNCAGEEPFTLAVTIVPRRKP
jgi:hypothetical protein